MPRGCSCRRNGSFWLILNDIHRRARDLPGCMSAVRLLNWDVVPMPLRSFLKLASSTA